MTDQLPPGQSPPGQSPPGRRLPDRARVVIIGGGVIGTSVAYHLAGLGWTDLLLLEQGQLSCGTTWHAAGLVGQLRATESGTRLVQYSTELYSRLEAETGLSTGFRRCGGVTVARTPDRLAQLRRTAATAEAYELDCELISPARAAELCPMMDTDDLCGAIWLPGDGRANPTDLTAALARGARGRGATIRERTRVTGITTAGGAVTGVRTAEGDIEAEVVVNCAGQWAKQVGALAGVTVPLHSAEHFYVVTEQIEGVHRGLPILRDPDGYTYFKEEVGGLVVGGFEPQAKPWVSPDQLPYPFEFKLLDEDWEHFSVLMESALHRIPVLAGTGIKKFYNGPESFTPDNQFILGEAAGLRNFFVAAGFNSVGIASAGGAGRALAEWITAGEPGTDLLANDIRRFAPFNGNNQWLHDRVGEILGLHYAVPWPNRELGTARPFRRSPAYHLLRAGRRRLRQPDGLGAGQLLRTARRGPGDRVLLGQAELAALVGRRAARHPRRGRRVRPDLVLQVPADRPRRRARAAVAVHRRRRGAARPDRLHRHAQRARHLRVRPHRHPAQRAGVPAGQQRRHHRAGQGSHPAAAAGRLPCRAGRPDLGLRGLRRDGPAVQGSAAAGCPGPTSATRRSRSAPAGRSTWATRPSARPGSPTWASSAGSCTCPRSSRSASTRT